MHTYRKDHTGKWQAGYQNADASFDPLGPAFIDECWAAAFASFMNGGRFSPGEIELIFPKEYPADTDDDKTTDPDPFLDDETTDPDRFRPAALDDYPIERKRG